MMISADLTVSNRCLILRYFIADLRFFASVTPHLSEPEAGTFENYKLNWSALRF